MVSIDRTMLEDFRSSGSLSDAYVVVEGFMREVKLEIGGEEMVNFQQREGGGKGYKPRLRWALIWQVN